MLPTGQLVSVVNGDDSIDCFTPYFAATSFQWLLNGSLLDTSSLRDVEEIIIFEGIVVSLVFSNLRPEYNNTHFGCGATDELGNTIFSQDTTLLVLQGKVQKCEYLLVLVGRTPTKSNIIVQKVP